MHMSETQGWELGTEQFKTKIKRVQPYISESLPIQS